MKEEHIRNEEWHRQYEEKQRIERELKERKNKEITDFKLIFQRAFRLHQARIIRDYLSSVERQTEMEGAKEDQTQWINWAKDKVDWYDPMVNRVDPIFDDQDKTKIFGEFLKEWV